MLNDEQRRALQVKGELQTIRKWLWIICRPSLVLTLVFWVLQLIVLFAIFLAIALATLIGIAGLSLKISSMDE